MRAILQPEQKWTPYRPWTVERRLKMSAIQRQARGIPIGMMRVYGHFMTERVAQDILPSIREIARLLGKQAADAFLKRTLRTSEDHALTVAERFVEKLRYSRTGVPSWEVEKRKKRKAVIRTQRLTATDRLTLDQMKEMETAQMLIDEGATAEEVAAYLKIPRTVINTLKGT